MNKKTIFPYPVLFLFGCIVLIFTGCKDPADPYEPTPYNLQIPQFFPTDFEHPF